MSNMYFNITFLQEPASLFPVNSEGLLVSTLFVVYLFYYILLVAKHPILLCQEGNFKSFLLDSCPVLQYRYWPTIWSFGSHAQTAIANIARGRLPDLPYKREILKLKDGGIVALDWLEADNTGHIVIFLPGVTGYSQTEYVKSLVPIAQKLGCRSVVFNNRGRGGVDILTPKTYSACNTEDLREVLEHISRKYPEFPIYGVGISLGGIILGHYLAESKSRSAISAAFLISVAFDIHAGEASLSIPGLNLMLNKYLTQRLCSVIKPHKQMFRSVNIDVDYVLKSKTVRDFDERFTSKIFNYKSVDEYYTAATLKSKITQINVPVLCLNAADDIFCPLTALPCDEVLRKRNIALVISSRGGHIGFMDGIYPAPPFFSERLFKQYLQGLLSTNVNQANKSMFL